MTPKRHPVRLREIFGLDPLAPALRQCWGAIVGDGHSPPSLWGPTSLRILRPRLSLPLWLGRDLRPRRVLVYQLPNVVPAPRESGYSVRVTYARDFRGRRMTYDSHVGTDFAVPVGTEVVAAAPGIVREVRNDMQRGGLKVIVDHGRGLMTSSNHLARSLVRPGQRVDRAAPIGLSGMSSVDGVLFSPWLAPHVHYTVLLDGEPVDPWSEDAADSLWRAGGEPTPARDAGDDAWEPTAWSSAAVDASIASCRDPAWRDRLSSVADLDERGPAVAFARMLSSHRFEAFPALVEPPHGRRPHLDLPFRAADYDGVVFADEL